MTVDLITTQNFNDRMTHFFPKAFKCIGMQKVQFTGKFWIKGFQLKFIIFLNKCLNKQSLCLHRYKILLNNRPQTIASGKHAFLFLLKWQHGVNNHGHTSQSLNQTWKILLISTLQGMCCLPISSHSMAVKVFLRRGSTCNVVLESNGSKP